MHFLSAGRDDRIHRWIAEQPQSQWRLSFTSVQSCDHGVLDIVHRREHDALESVHRKEHDAVVDMEWELEELERQIALTASAFGRDWRTSMLSVDTLRQSVDLKSLKHASQLTVRPEELQEILDQVKARDGARVEVVAEADAATALEKPKVFLGPKVSLAPRVSLEESKGQDGEVLLDPKVSLDPRVSLEESKGQDGAKGEVLLDQTNAEVPLKGIEVSLESKSQAPLDDTTAGTERTLDRRREGRIISQPPKYPPEPPRSNLSRSRTAPPPITTTRTSASSSLSRPPITFILQESASPLPSAMHFTPTALDLDAFPTTPRSFTSFVPGQPEAHEGQLVVAPAQELLSPSPTTPYDSTGGSDASTPSLSAFPATPASPWPVDRRDFPFPPPVPSLPHAKSPPSDSDGDGDDCSVSGVSVEGQLSSRFSVFSSRFSVSSGSRSRAGSRAASRSRAGSRATSRSRAGSSAAPVPPPPPPPTASMRGLMMSVSQQLTRSRSHTMLPRLTIRTGAGHAPSASISLAQSSQSALEHGGRGWFGTAPATPKTPAMPVPLRTKSPALPAAPVTPVTPSSAVGAFFGRARSVSLARKQRLVVSGVKRDENCEENVRRWCENLSPVKHMWRAPGTENVYIHFRDKNAYKKIGGIEARQVSIPGVGTVALNCVSG